MNKTRRNEIQNVCYRIEGIIKKLEEIQIEEEMYYDNIPENLQGSERAALSEEAIEYLDNAKDGLNSALENLEDIM